MFNKRLFLLKDSILIGHGLGLSHGILQSNEYKAVIGLASYFKFNNSMVSQRFIDNFKYGISKDYIEAVVSYIGRLGYRMNKELKLNPTNITLGLNMLEQADITNEALLQKNKILMLNSQNDSMLDTQEVMKQIQDYKHAICEDGDHLLGYNNVAWVYKEIQSFLDGIK